ESEQIVSRGYGVIRSRRIAVTESRRAGINEAVEDVHVTEAGRVPKAPPAAARAAAATAHAAAEWSTSTAIADNVRFHAIEAPRIRNPLSFGVVEGIVGRLAVVGQILKVDCRVHVVEAVDAGLGRHQAPIHKL